MLYFVDLPKTVEFFGNFMKFINLISVDFTELHLNEFNLKRYLLNLLHFTILVSTFLIVLLLTNCNSLFILIDNQYFPKNIKVLSNGIMILAIMSISIRFDYLIAEWNKRLAIYKFYYYIESEIKTKHGFKKHGLTNQNYEKLSVLAKFIEIFFIKGKYKFCYLILQFLINIRSYHFDYRIDNSNSLVHHNPIRQIDFSIVNTISNPFNLLIDTSDWFEWFNLYI